MPVLTHLGPAAPAGLTRYESAVFGERVPATTSSLRCSTCTRSRGTCSSRAARRSQPATRTSSSRRTATSIRPTCSKTPTAACSCRHRRLVQALLPDVAARQARRARRDLPRAAQRRAARSHDPRGAKIGVGRRRPPQQLAALLERPAAGRAGAVDGAARESGAAAVVPVARAGAAFDPGRRSTRRRMDVDAHRRRGSARGGAQGARRSRRQRAAGRDSRGGAASRRRSRAGTGSDSAARQSRIATGGRRGARPHWRSSFGAGDPRRDRGPRRSESSVTHWSLR